MQVTLVSLTNAGNNAFVNSEEVARVLDSRDDPTDGKHQWARMTVVSIQDVGVLPKAPSDSGTVMHKYALTGLDSDRAQQACEATRVTDY